MKISLSFICPCSSDDNTIHEMVEKLRNQTFEDWEFIVVDNSEDGIVSEELNIDDSRIKCVKSPTPLSAGIARNVGLGHAQGDYVWFVDSDDFFSFSSEGKLSELMDTVFQRGSDVYILPCSDSIGRNTINNFVTKAADFESLANRTFRKETIIATSACKEMFPKYLANPWNKLVSRQFLFKHPNVRFQDVRFSNDYFFSFALFAEMNTITFIDSSPVYRHNRRAASTSGVINRSNNISEIVKITKKFLNLKCDEYVKKEILNRWLRSMNSILTGVQKHRSQQGSFIKDMEFLLSDLLADVDIPADAPLVKQICGDRRPKLKKFATKAGTTAETRSVQKTFSFDDDGNEKHDAVFVLGPGSKYKDAELRLAIKSMRMHCKFVNRIIVVGSRPRCELDGLGVTYISCEDPYRTNKDSNMMYKVLRAIRKVPDLSEDFLLCSDDQVVTKPCSWNDFKPKYTREITSDDPIFENATEDRGKWINRLLLTVKEIEEQGRTALLYEPHIWSPVNKYSFKEMTDSLEGLRYAGVIKSQYYNSIDGLDNEKLHDHVFVNDVNFGEVFKKPPTFISYNDGAFNSAEFRDKLSNLFG